MINKTENKICQNCKKGFVIEPDDFSFYEKIKVPPPTFCPECRMQRRFSYRNERTLHRRKCAITGKDLISCFSPEAPFKVIDRDLWWGDSWDAFESGRNYNFKKPFFLQFQELMQETPMPSLFIGKCVDTKYGNYIGEFKNSYLVSASWLGENIMYASRCNSCKDSLDMFTTVDCEFCYGDTACIKCNQVFFSEHAVTCSNSAFLYDCRNCVDCFLCTGLRNKQNCIENKQYSREDYLRKIKEYNIGAHSGLVKAKQKFEEIKLKAFRRFANIVNGKDSTGDNISNVFNCKNSFDISGDIRDSKYLINAVGPLEQAFDGYGVGANFELLYEGIDSGVNGSKISFTATVWDSMNMYYSFNCHGCNNCFGCVGLRKKSYCILNKQYSKEEYEKFIPKIIENMNTLPFIDKKGRIYKYGEYFPTELSPFAYNETVAQDFFPRTQKEIEGNGWYFSEIKQGNYTVTKHANDLPDSIKDAMNSIIEDIVECENCKKVFKILENELISLRRFNIALPRKCFECRHRERFLTVNFPRLYSRQCMCDKKNHFHQDKCLNEFETSYAPDRPEIVYCEKCYQQEVY